MDFGKGMMDKARDMLEKTAGDKFKVDALGFVLKMATGHFKTDPFDEDVLEGMRRFIAEKFGMEAGDLRVAEGQCFRLRMIANMLKEAGDPDWRFYLTLEEGVPIGARGDMPSAPLLFESKTSWARDEPQGGECSEKENYLSVADHRDQVLALFREEEQLGWMEEVTNEQAKARFGTDLYVAALAVIEEGEKIRVVHDGSNGIEVNHKIRPKGQVRSPGAGEIRCLMRERLEAGKRTFTLLGDASKAHRRIKILERDWGFQACRVDSDTVWLNKVGTYGVSSAGYYWSRAASGLVRLSHYSLAGRGPLDLLLFADDWKFLAGDAEQIRDLGALVLLLCSLGVPFKWSKFRGGFSVSWIGYWIDWDQNKFGISASRAAWLVGATAFQVTRSASLRPSLARLRPLPISLEVRRVGVPRRRARPSMFAA